MQLYVTVSDGSCLLRCVFPCCPARKITAENIESGTDDDVVDLPVGHPCACAADCKFDQAVCSYKSVVVSTCCFAGTRIAARRLRCG